MADLIRRQDAINCLCNGKCNEEMRWCDDGPCPPVTRIMKLPSVQSEIICCRDCKHCIREDYEEYTPYGLYNTIIIAFCELHYDRELGEYRNVNLDNYCAWAERNDNG